MFAVLVAGGSAEWNDSTVQQRVTKGASTNHDQPNNAAVGGVAPYLNVGTFRFWFVGQRWEWSDEVARMHGYDPGSVEPTTKLLLSHKHPEDRAHVQDLLDSALQHLKRDGLPMEPVPARRNQYEANGTHRGVSTSVARRRHG